MTLGLPKRMVSSRDNKEKEVARKVSLAVEADGIVVEAVLFPGIVAEGEVVERHEERVKETPGRYTIHSISLRAVVEYFK